MALNGNLSEFSVLETLQVIALQQKTGTLYIESGRQRHGLHFREGRLIGCQPVNPTDPDPFLDCLVGLGQVGRDEERRIRMLAADQGVDLWRQITNSVKLEAETLEETRSLVLQGVLDRILLWNRGHFEFDAGPVPPASGPPWNVETALLESMRRLDEAADLKAGGFPLTAVAEVAGESTLERSPDAETHVPVALERAILSRLDGRRSLGEIVGDIGVAEYDVLSAIRELRNCGAVRLDTRSSRGSVTQILIEQPVRLRNPALAAFLGVSLIALTVSGVQVHRLTARISSPRAQAAAQHRAEVDTRTALGQALEIYEQRNGRYPASLGELVETSLWPADTRTQLDTVPYRLVNGGASYELANGTGTSARVSKTGPSQPSPSTSRP